MDWTANLPDLCLQRIIGLCQVRHVFQTCLLVNRRWNQVAEHSLRTRKRLLLFQHDEGRTSEEKQMLHSADIDVLVIWERKERRERLVHSLRKMTRITDLSLIETQWPAELLSRLVIPLAAGIHKLDIAHCALPHEPGLVYPSLQSLTCSYLSKTAAAACPRLQHLSGFCFAPVAQLSETVTSLVIRVECGSESGEARHLRAFRRLKSLKQVTLFWWPSGQYRHVKEMRDIRRIFSTFSNLIAFEFVSMYFHNLDHWESGVETLVRNNPHLQAVRFSSMSVFSDRCLESLARLPDLQSLTIHTQGRTGITNAAISTLLKKANSDPTRQVEVNITHTDQWRV